MLRIWVPSAGAPVPVTSALGQTLKLLGSSLFELLHRVRSCWWGVSPCLLPAIAHAHGGPCSGNSSLASAAYVASTVVSVFAVLVAPFLAAKFCPGQLRWRILLGLMLALAGVVAVAVIAFFNFLAGMGCPNPWTLTALNVTPSVFLGTLLWWLWALRYRGNSGK